MLIVADDLGIGDVSLYSGSELVQTPRIDSLGRAGRQFDCAYATSATSAIDINLKVSFPVIFFVS